MEDKDSPRILCGEGIRFVLDCGCWRAFAPIVYIGIGDGKPSLQHHWYRPNSCPKNHDVTQCIPQNSMVVSVDRGTMQDFIKETLQ